MADETRADKWRLIRGTILKSEDRHVLLTLFLIQGDNNAAFCKQETLAEEVGVHPRSVRRSLQRLNAAGIVLRDWQPRGGVPMRHYAIDFEALKTVQRGNGRTPASYPETTDGRTSASYPESADGRTPVSAAVGHERPKPQDTSVLQERSIEHPLKIQSERTRDYIPESLDSEPFRNAWGEWLEYRRQRKQSLTPATIGKQLKKLAAWGPVVAVQSIEQSIEHGWQGLFELKNNGTTAGNAGALKAWRSVLKAAKDHCGDGAGFEAAIGPELAGIVKALRLTRQKIDQADNFDRREQEREFIQAFIRQGAAA